MRRRGGGSRANVCTLFERALVARKLLTFEEANGRGVPVEVEVQFEGYYFYSPAVLDLAPEDCYPDESYVEIQEQELVSVERWDGKKLLRIACDPRSFQLTAREEREVEEQVMEACNEY